MSNALEYTDEEIHSLLAIIANEKSAAATQTTPTEAASQTRARHSDAGIGRELSIEEILKKMETEMAESKPAVRIRL